MTSTDFFEALQTQFQNKLPFVAYRKPRVNSIQALLQHDNHFHQIADYNESGFVFAPFDDSQPAVLIPSSHSKSIQIEFEVSKDTFVSHSSSDIEVEQKQNHVSLVQKGIDAINDGEFKKVVLSRSEQVILENPNPFEIFKNLLNKYETAFIYCFFHPEIGLWLGATPETLLKIEGNRLTTMALAGTQKYQGIIDVVWGQKEREEQQLVTDFIVKSLQSNQIQISETETLKAGNLLHLKTDIGLHFNPDTFNFKQILKDLHPTPAVCGLPKQEAKRFILKNENYNREFYTGFLGELNLKQRKLRNSNRQNVENNAYAAVKTVSNLFVNLRCMKLKENQAIIYVGGGITKDSIAENEWEETVAKSQIIKSIL